MSAAFALLALPILLSLASVPQQPQQPQQPANRYIGAAQCKNCHQAKESGEQYGIWEKEKHAQAYAELASDKAKAYGKERGIAEPQKSEKCLKCHVTAYEKPKEELHRTFDPKLGVQCETCHGPGEKHRRARMVAAAESGEKGAKPAYTVIPDDEVIKKPDAKTCVVCHNEESPGYKPFCYHQFAGQIRHVNPLKPRTDAERAALSACTCTDKCVCKTGSADGKCPGGTKPIEAKDAKAPKK
jgi:hypothetical protein